MLVVFLRYETTNITGTTKQVDFTTVSWASSNGLDWFRQFYFTQPTKKDEQMSLEQS